MKQIVFVCTGNTCRSPMAEGICNALAAEKGWEIRAVSCGLAAFPGDTAAPHAIEAARRYGADLTGHRARALSHYILEEADAVYCMTRRHAKAILSALPEMEEKVFCLRDTDISDPFGGGEGVYEKTAEEIYQALLERFAKGG